MNWIDIRDELPVIPKGKYAIEVIVATFDFGCDEYDITTKMYSDEGFRELIYDEKGSEWIPSIDPVVYWMYKPDPPTRIPKFKDYFKE